MIPVGPLVKTVQFPVPPPSGVNFSNTETEPLPDNLYNSAFATQNEGLYAGDVGTVEASHVSCDIW